MFEFTFIDVDMAGPNKLIERTVYGEVVDQGRFFMEVETKDGILAIPRSSLLRWRAHDV